MSAKPPKKSRPVLWAFLGLIVIGAVIAAYIVFGPHPTDFAGGRRVALKDYMQADPTGVPAELKSASLAERGEYLTRAADCVVCHTAPGAARSCCRSARYIRPTSRRMAKPVSATTATPPFSMPSIKGSDATTPSCIRPCPTPATPTYRTPMHGRSRRIYLR